VIERPIESGNGVSGERMRLERDRDMPANYDANFDPPRGYLTDSDVVGDSFIVPPSLGDQAGLVGAMLLAARAWREA